MRFLLVLILCVPMFGQQIQPASLTAGRVYYCENPHMKLQTWHAIGWDEKKDTAIMDYIDVSKGIEIEASRYDGTTDHLPRCVMSDTRTSHAVSTHTVIQQTKKRKDSK